MMFCIASCELRSFFTPDLTPVWLLGRVPDTQWVCAPLAVVKSTNEDTSDKAVLTIELERFGRTKAVSKSVKGTVNVGHGEGRLLTLAACFLGLCTN